MNIGNFAVESESQGGVTSPYHEGESRVRVESKVESKFTGGNFRDAWQGTCIIKSMAAISINTSPDLHSRSQMKLQVVNNDALSDDMNKFVIRFEKFDFVSDFADLMSSFGNAVMDQNTAVKYLKATSVNKSPWPDGICGRTLQYWEVSKCKYLGSVFDDMLKRDENTDLVIKKCQQHLHFPEVEVLLCRYNYYFVSVIHWKCVVFFIHFLVLSFKFGEQKQFEKDCQPWV